jgi:glycosyltransferase involved in cell wall biosynthesis
MKHANVIALLASQISFSKVPLVIAEHSAASVSFDENPGMKSAIHKVLMRYLYPRAAKIVAVSQGVANELVTILHLRSDQVHVIWNPIVSDRLIAASTAPVAHRWFWDRSIPIILSVGRLTEAKDFHTLIRALGRAMGIRKLRLIILGEGALRVSLETLISELCLSEYVDLHGFVDNPFAWMKKADLFVLSSRWEGFGNVLVEAMACGTPVVSTDCPGGPAEILEQGKWGRLVPVGDEEALAQAMLESLEKARPSAIERAMEFSITRAADSYWSLLAK